MHEMTIVANVLEIAHRQATGAGAARINRVVPGGPVADMPHVSPRELGAGWLGSVERRGHQAASCSSGCSARAAPTCRAASSPDFKPSSWKP